MFANYQRLCGVLVPCFKVRHALLRLVCGSCIRNLTLVLRTPVRLDLVDHPRKQAICLIPRFGAVAR